MKSQERREREFSRREDEFLALSRRLIIANGYAGFGMDRLAEATEYSKGTVYQHFISKEDVVVALACQSMRRRVELFDRAGRFAGRPRERMTAVGVAEEYFFRHHPHNYRSEQIIKLADLEDRASEKRRSHANLQRTSIRRYGRHRWGWPSRGGARPVAPDPGVFRPGVRAGRLADSAASRWQPRPPQGLRPARGGQGGPERGVPARLAERGQHLQDARPERQPTPLSAAR